MKRVALAALAAVLLLAAACTPKAAPPASGVDSGFVAFGDAGTGTVTQQEVADAMERWIASGHRADALVEAGDDVYPDGNPSRFAATLDMPYKDLRASRPLWVALGNHDVAGGYGDDQLRHLGLPDLPYAKSLPGVQLLFLDANHPDATQAQWLETQLSKTGPALRVVVFHQPPYSCGVEHGNTPAVIQWWVPIFEKYRVALVISGHEHYYERFKSANDVTYVVTGGGGAGIYGRNPACTGTPPSQFTAGRHHFVGVEIDGSTMTLTVIARTGETLDQATISR